MQTLIQVDAQEVRTCVLEVTYDGAQVLMLFEGTTLWSATSVQGDRSSVRPYRSWSHAINCFEDSQAWMGKDERRYSQIVRSAAEYLVVGTDVGCRPHFLVMTLVQSMLNSSVCVLIGCN